MTASSGEARSRWRLFAAAAFATFVAMAGLWSLPPLDRDESRFAQATAQMLETGDLVSIRFQDRERNKKPAGVYWLQAASVSAFSSVEAREIWAYRIPSVIGVIFAAIFTFLAGRRLYDERTGFLAALLLASAPVVAAEATIAKTDGVLLALVCLAQWAFIEIYAAYKERRKTGWGTPAAFWTAHGAATLVKGPIAPMISLLTGLGLTLAERRLGWIIRMRPFTGLAILIVMVAPWALAIHVATDGRFFADAIGGDMLGKVGEAQESHVGPPGYHTLLVWILFWPAAALIGPGLVHIWRDRAQWQARFLFAWILPSWLVFEIAATKLPHYVMPLYPALAMVAAHAVLKDGDRQTTLRKLGALTYGGVGLVAAAAIAVLPIILSAAPMTAVCYTLAAAFSVATLWTASVFWRGRAGRGALYASALAALYAWALMGAVLPRLDALMVSPKLSAALDDAGLHPIIDGGDDIALAGYSEPSAVFLIGTETVLANGAEAGRLLANGAVAAAAVEARQADAFFAVAGPRPRALAVIDGLNYSNGKPVEITIYVPAQRDSE